MQTSGTQPSAGYAQRSRGVPAAVVLAAVVVALLLGMFIGRSGASAELDTTAVAGQDSPVPNVDGSMSDDLEHCRAEKRQLITALERVGVNVAQFRATSPIEGGEGSDEPRRGQEEASVLLQDSRERQPEVRVRSGYARKLPNRPDVRVSGFAFNGEAVAVEGMLHLTLLTIDMQHLDETSIPMLLEPGKTEWEHTFRWVPDQQGTTYYYRAEWETMGY